MTRKKQPQALNDMALRRLPTARYVAIIRAAEVWSGATAIMVAAELPKLQSESHMRRAVERGWLEEDTSKPTLYRATALGRALATQVEELAAAVAKAQARAARPRRKRVTVTRTVTAG